MVRERVIEYENGQISCPDDLADLGFKLLDRADREVTLVVCLNAKHHVNAVHVVSMGSLTASLVHPREVYKPAILSNSAAIALVHNHPSGNTEPSREDIELTRLLIEAGKVLGIPLVDHVIVGDGAFCSLSNRNVCEFE